MFSSAFGLNSSDSDMEGELRELILDKLIYHHFHIFT